MICIDTYLKANTCTDTRQKFNGYISFGGKVNANRAPGILSYMLPYSLVPGPTFL